VGGEAKETPMLVRSNSDFNPFAARDPEPNPTCCGQPMEPRLARMRDREGQVSFVAVWRCLECGRASVG